MDKNVASLQITFVIYVYLIVTVWSFTYVFHLWSLYLGPPHLIPFLVMLKPSGLLVSGIWGTNEMELLDISMRLQRDEKKLASKTKIPISS